LYWILAAIFLLIALKSPRWRPGAIVGCVVLAVLLAWGMVQRLNQERAPSVAVERGRPGSPALTLKAVPLAEVVAEDLRLSGEGAPFELTGRIRNDSRDTQLRSITIQMTRRDCYDGALDPSGCVVLWEDQRWIELAIAPQQMRPFQVAIWARGAATRARGKTKDEFRVIAAGGEAVR
jgi:hypothetical protein